MPDTLLVQPSRAFQPPIVSGLTQRDLDRERPVDRAYVLDKHGRDDSRIVLLTRGVEGYYVRMHPCTVGWGMRRCRRYVMRLNAGLDGGVTADHARALHADWTVGFKGGVTWPWTMALRTNKARTAARRVRPQDPPADVALCCRPWAPPGYRLYLVRRGDEIDTPSPSWVKELDRPSYGIRKVRRLANRWNARHGVSAAAAGALACDVRARRPSAPLSPAAFAQHRRDRRFMRDLDTTAGDTTSRSISEGSIAHAAHMRLTVGELRQTSAATEASAALAEVIWANDCGRGSDDVRLPSEIAAAEVMAAWRKLIALAKVTPWSRLARTPGPGHLPSLRNRAVSTRSMLPAERRTAIEQYREQRQPLFLAFINAVRLWRRVRRMRSAAAVVW